MRESKAFWLWGQFSDLDRKNLLKIKKQVQSKLPSPNFDVHLTLAGPFKKIDNSFINYLKVFQMKFYPLKLTLGDYQFNNEIYKSFYIKVLNTEHLNQLREDIYDFKSFDKYNEYDPHISLTYGDYPSSFKKELIINLVSPPKMVFMDRISIVNVEEKKNLWKIIDTYFLH